MAVSYKKLFKVLIDRDMKKKDFREYVGISYSTLSKLEKGENTNVDVLERICLKMNCHIEDNIARPAAGDTGGRAKRKRKGDAAIWRKTNIVLEQSRYVSGSASFARLYLS